MSTTDDDGLAGRKRKLEEDYFRKQDQELIERMRKAATAEQARRELGNKTGIQDPDLLNELSALGFTPETVVLLPLVPLVQTAWAESGVSAAERALIVQFARKRGIQEGSAADAVLSEWLTDCPSQDVFRRADRLIGAVLAAGSGPAADLSADDLVKYCENIAAASGGILGIGRISAEERAAISEISTHLRKRGS
jgi:hypothetical protein